MKTVIEIATKDLRRFWLAALLLAGITGLKLFLVTGALATEISPDGSAFVMRYQVLLLFAQWILTFFVAVAIVQEDPISEPGSFWEILPITRAQLLAAKISSVFVVTVVPVLVPVTAAWMIFGLPIAHLGWPIAAVMLAQLALACLSFAFGSLTKNVAHVVLWFVGAWVILCIPAILSLPNSSEPVTVGTQLTQRTLITVILFLGAVAITLNQYFGRSRRRSIAFLGAAVLAAIVLAFGRVPFDLSSLLSPAQQRLEAEIAALPVIVSKSEISTARPNAEATSLVRVSIDDRGSSLFLMDSAIFGKWIPADGKPVASLARGYQTKESAAARAVAHALGLKAASAPAFLEIGAETRLSPSDASRILNATIPYEGQVVLNVRRIVIDSEVVLATGTKHYTPDGSFELTHVEVDGSLVRVQIKSRNCGLIVESGGFLGANAEMKPTTNYFYVMVNQNSQTLLIPRGSTTGMSAYAYGALFEQGKWEFVLPDAEKLGNLEGWKLVQIRFGSSERATLRFRQLVRSIKVAVIIRDPSWFE